MFTVLNRITNALAERFVGKPDANSADTHLTSDGRIGAAVAPGSLGLAGANVPQLPTRISEADYYDSHGVPQGANQHLIPDWFALGQNLNVSHLVIRRDHIQGRDYPYFSKAGVQIGNEIDFIEGENACNTIAVFNYREPLQEQLGRKIRLNF